MVPPIVVSASEESMPALASPTTTTDSFASPTTTLGFPRSPTKSNPNSATTPKFSLSFSDIPRLHLSLSPRRASAIYADLPESAKFGSQSARIVYHRIDDDVSTTLSLVKQVTTIGRKDGNSIVLACGKVSKYHAAIRREAGGRWSVTDKNSSNGVKVNDELIEPNMPRSLQDGDKIEIGSFTLSFYDESFRWPLDVDRNSSLVTILPSEQEDEESFSIRAEIQAGRNDDDFAPESEVSSEQALRDDYEKLRLAYQISKLALTSNLNEVLEKTLELIISVLPVIDRCVVLLWDRETQLLRTNMVRLREGKGNEGKEILLSSTILQRVYQTRTCLITSDACEDPELGMAKSIKGKIRSVISVPLIAHDKVLGILHLDSKAKIGAFVEKDLALIKTICSQTAVLIENAMLFKDSEAEIKAREQLSRFLPPQVVQRMIEGQEEVHKEGREMVGTVIFADIRGFTQLAERSTPSEVFDLLNDFFERLVRIVFKYNGVVDKFIGDALMGVFGTLGDEEDSEIRSVAAALEFKKVVKQMNEERIRYGKAPIAVGIGLNTGMLVSGFVGSSQRLEYTVIGDTVNTSSRICDLAQTDQVLISESTFVLVQGKVNTRYVGQHQLKGKSKPVGVYEAIGIKD